MRMSRIRQRRLLLQQRRQVTIVKKLQLLFWEAWR